MNSIFIPLSFFFYLVGAIPTGYLFSRFFFNIDITEHGSGNIGATNVARVLGRTSYFFGILVFDAVKAWGALTLATMVTAWYQFIIDPSSFMVASFFLLIGNGYSCFLRFKGGKSVSTGVGILAYFTPRWLGVAIALFIPCIALLRQVGISVLITVTLIAFLCYICQPHDPVSGLLFFIVLWLYFRHTENIKQFLCGNFKR